MRLRDYEDAITDRPAFILKVHPSNFVVEGFTAAVSVRELATLPVPLVVDIGSGLLRPHPRLPHEPDAETTLRAGATLVTASGDKLLGGPQAGLLLGESEMVEGLRRHPFARALRVDKLTLAALEATLAGPANPVARALGRSTEELMVRARELAGALADVPAVDDASAVPTVGAVGGGGAPGVELPSAALSLPAELAGPLRTGATPVVGRVHDGRLLLDLLAVAAEDDAALLDAVRRVVETACT